MFVVLPDTSTPQPTSPQLPVSSRLSPLWHSCSPLLQCCCMDSLKHPAEATLHQHSLLQISCWIQGAAISPAGIALTSSGQLFQTTSRPSTIYVPTPSVTSTREYGCWQPTCRSCPTQCSDSSHAVASWCARLGQHFLEPPFLHSNSPCSLASSSGIAPLIPSFAHGYCKYFLRLLPLLANSSTTAMLQTCTRLLPLSSSPRCLSAAHDLPTCLHCIISANDPTTVWNRPQ